MPTTLKDKKTTRQIVPNVKDSVRQGKGKSFYRREEGTVRTPVKARLKHFKLGRSEVVRSKSLVEVGILVRTINVGLFVVLFDLRKTTIFDFLGEEGQSQTVGEGSLLL